MKYSPKHDGTVTIDKKKLICRIIRCLSDIYFKYSSLFSKCDIYITTSGQYRINLTSCDVSIYSMTITMCFLNRNTEQIEHKTTINRKWESLIATINKGNIVYFLEWSSSILHRTSECDMCISIHEGNRKRYCIIL